MSNKRFKDIVMKEIPSQYLMLVQYNSKVSK